MFGPNEPTNASASKSLAPSIKMLTAGHLEQLDHLEHVEGQPILVLI